MLSMVEESDADSSGVRSSEAPGRPVKGGAAACEEGAAVEMSTRHGVAAMWNKVGGTGSSMQLKGAWYPVPVVHDGIARQTCTILDRRAALNAHAGKTPLAAACALMQHSRLHWRPPVHSCST